MVDYFKRKKADSRAYGREDVDAMLIAGLTTTTTPPAIIGGKARMLFYRDADPTSSSSNLRWSKFVRTRG